MRQTQLEPITQAQYQEALEGVVRCERDRRNMEREKKASRDAWKEQTEEIEESLAEWLGIVSRWEDQQD